MFPFSPIGTLADIGRYVSTTSSSMTFPTVGPDNMIGKVIGRLETPAPASIESIQKILRRFPELQYHLGALATFVSHTTQYPWVSKRVCGPGGISVTVEPRLNHSDKLTAVVSQTLERVLEANSSVVDAPVMSDMVELIGEPPADNDRYIRDDTLVCKELVAVLLENNAIYTQLRRAALSLIKYNAVVLDFTDDWSTMKVYPLDEIKKVTATGHDVRDEATTWVEKKTDQPLSERAYVVMEGNGPADSAMGLAVHYLEVIDALEASMSIERIVKSNSFVVWKVGVDGLPGEVVNPWLNVYRDRVMSRLRAGTDSSNMSDAAMSRSLTASHIFVPNFKESPTEVSTVNTNYRPLLTDLEYWWGKAFMTLGIPPYYASVLSMSGNNISGDITAFHEAVLGSRVRVYQDLLEGVLNRWCNKFVRSNIPMLYERYKITLGLPTYVSGGEEGRSEYMRRVNQFASAYSTLSVSGVPLDPRFSVSLMFPNADPDEVIDWTTRKVMNPEASGRFSPDLSPPDDIDALLDLMDRGVVQASPAEAPTTDLAGLLDQQRELGYERF